MHPVRSFAWGPGHEQGTVRHCRSPASAIQRAFDGHQIHVEEISVLESLRLGPAAVGVHCHEIAVSFLVVGSFKLAHLVLAYEHPMHGSLIGPRESAEQMTVCAVPVTFVTSNCLAGWSDLAS